MHETDADTVDQTNDELSLTQFTVLIVFIFLGTAIVGFLVWAGFNSWRWELALSLGALAFLITRVAKTYIRRRLSDKVDIVEIIANLNEEENEFSLEDVDMSPEIRRALSKSSVEPKATEEKEPELTVGQFLLFYIFMIFVAIFWYGMGMIFGLIFG